MKCSRTFDHSLGEKLSLSLGDLSRKWKNKGKDYEVRGVGLSRRSK